MGEQNVMNMYEFAREHPKRLTLQTELSSRYVASLIEGISREYDAYEVDRQAVVGSLPELEEKVNSFSRDLRNIQDNLASRTGNGDYDPTDYFSIPEVNELKDCWSMLGLYDSEKINSDGVLPENVSIDDSSIGEDLGGNDLGKMLGIYDYTGLSASLIESGNIRKEDEDIYLFRKSRKEDSIKRKWGDRFHYTGLFGPIIAGVPATAYLVYDNWDKIENVLENSEWAEIVATTLVVSPFILGTVSAVSCLALGGLGKKVGSLLGGKVPLKHYYKNPFTEIADEMESRVDYISEKLSDAKDLKFEKELKGGEE